jgi:hypothetical protein
MEGCILALDIAGATRTIYLTPMIFAPCSSRLVTDQDATQSSELWGSGPPSPQFASVINVG